MRKLLLFIGFAAGAPASWCLGAQFTFITPSDDQWNYPFAFGGGSRENASCFGSVMNPGFAFNDRDGELIVAWNTSNQIVPGQPAESYGIGAVRVTLTSEPNAAWPIDTTVDEWFTYDQNQDGQNNGDQVARGQPGDTDGESDDVDPGRPTELFGASFGPFYTQMSWTENSLYVGSDPFTSNPRDPFPFVFLADGPDRLHVEDNVKGLFNTGLGVSQFTPQPWATGSPVGYTPGSQPTVFDVIFEVNLSLSGGAVKRYFQEQLSAGRLTVVITSLKETSQQAASGYPSFYTKEAVGSIAGAKAPRLDVSICTAVAPDFDRDCDVDGNDVTVLAGCRSGSGVHSLTVGCEASDLDHDGDVDQDDFGIFQRCYSGGGHEPAAGCDQ